MGQNKIKSHLRNGERVQLSAAVARPPPPHPHPSLPLVVTVLRLQLEATHGTRAVQLQPLPHALCTGTGKDHGTD